MGREVQAWIVYIIWPGERQEGEERSGVGWEGKDEWRAEYIYM